MSRRLAVLFLCALAGSALARPEPRALTIPSWTFTDLGTLGGNASWATAVNNAGEVVGWAGSVKGEYTDIDPEFHAFAYNNGAMRDLGRAGENSAARSVNDAGTIAGYTDSSGVVTWNRARQTALAFRGTPHRVNRSGTLAGTYDGATGDFRAFVYRAGVLTELGTLGGAWSSAAAISDRDTVVGSSVNAEGNVRGFVYARGAMREIGTFGGPVSQAYDVNSRGLVVGSAGNATDGVQAFIHDGALHPLLPAAGPHEISEAYAINEPGQVVGMLNGEGFLWSNGRLTMLRDLLTEEQRAVWGVLTPQDINDRGWIVGVASTEGVNGTAGGFRRAFLLRPDR
jgi:probable HAF family extracellular repeat protein